MANIKSLFKKLTECTGEDVGIHNGTSNVYTEIFRTMFKTDSNRIFGCDGYWKLPEELVGNEVYMLTEYKYGRNLKNKFELCKVLAQCVYYLRAIRDNGMIVPKVVFVGDENECVIVPTKAILSSLDCGSDFSKSASNASADEKLMERLMSNVYVNYAFVYDIDEDMDTEGLVRTTFNIAKADDEQVLVEINERNIEKVWKKFKNIVFGSSKKVGENEQVSVFVHYITDHNSFYRDSRKPKTFMFNGKEYSVVDAKQFTAFCNHFGYVRSVKQKEKLRATCDRFIEDTNRRMKGEFYTPTAFVDYAHDMIAKEFGEDWKEKYVVWDCAWGTGNLTRDYRFKELYCSTLEQAELDIAQNVNPEATKFQFDFLNDGLEKLPDGLKKALKEKKPILFLINPPYGTMGSKTMEIGWEKKKGISKTQIGEEMAREKLGKSSHQLYAQFFYRIVKLRQKYCLPVNIASFTTCRFLSGGDFEKFRPFFFKHFEYRTAMKFDSRHFSDTSAGWPIFFSMWRSGETTVNEFPCSLVDEDGDDIKEIGHDVVYNMDRNARLSDWIREDVKSLKGEDSVQMKSALAWREDGQLSGTLVEGSLGYLRNSGNDVAQNAQGVTLYTSCAAHGHGVSILPVNFERCLMTCASRKLITNDWTNNEKEYIAPDSIPDEFLNDSIVWGLFCTAANQSSLRSVTYKNKLWDIKNEFFWMSREEMMELADNNGFEELYNDAKTADDRFVYKKLQSLNLSPEAQDVLNKASEIVRKSFKYRQSIHEGHPEYHLNAWDAGWYQIKKLCAELPMLKSDMEDFKALFKILSDKMRPMVYELGFLKA